MRSSRNVTLVKTAKELTTKRGKYLAVEITQVRAKGGGVITGPKAEKTLGTDIARWLERRHPHDRLGG